MTEFPLMNKCLEKAKTMPHFTIVAADDFALDVVHHWVSEAIAHAVNPKKVAEAMNIIDAMNKWREENPDKCKIPD